MKPRVFIGSSTEGLKVAAYIKDALNTDPSNTASENEMFECVLWNDGTVFTYNTSYLDALLSTASMFDFGILVATKDDKSVVREEGFDTPRDNVMFEFGLFIGRLGSNRAFVIQEKEAKLPSDMAGITIPQFIKTDDLTQSESLNKEIKKLRSNILDKIKLRELGLLPSTGVAIGYFNNFITPVCNYLYNIKSLPVNGNTYNKYELQIIIPKELKENMRMESDYYFKQNNFVEFTLNAESGRGIKTVCRADEQDASKIILCDMPTTLNALFIAIVMYLKKGSVGKSNEQILLELRELYNFKLTLQAKIDENTYFKNTVKIIEG